MLAISELGFPANAGLYEIFNYYYNARDVSTHDMEKLLRVGILREGEPFTCFHVRDWFSWFDSGMVIRGELKLDSQTEWGLGEFNRSLNYKAAKSGGYIAKMYGSGYGAYFQDAVAFEDLFWGYGADMAAFIMSRESVSREITSTELINLCKQTRVVQSVNNGVLKLRPSYTKDFSMCYSPVPRGATYGVIIDCEGQLGKDGSLDNGCRETGGVVYARSGRMLVCLDRFSCEEPLLGATLSRMIDNIRGFGFTGRSLNVLTFGLSDRKMLTASIEKCSKYERNQFLRLFKYTDCRQFVERHAEEVIGRSTLSNLARSLGVSVLVPKHKAINDARTLFNVLAMILYLHGEFPL